MINMIKRIVALSGTYKPMILLGIFFNFLKSAAMAVMMLAVYYIMSNLEQLTVANIQTAIGIMLVSIAGRFLFQWRMDICMGARGFDLFRDYRLLVGQRMRRAPMGYYSSQRLGSIQTVLTSTVVELEQYSMLAIMDLTGGAMMAVVMVVMLSFYNGIFALITLLGLLAGIRLLDYIQKAAARYTPEVQQAQEEMTAQTLEYVRGIAVIRAFPEKIGVESRLNHSFERKQRADLKQEKSSLHLLKMHSAVYQITGALLLFAAAALYLSGSIAQADCLMFIISAFVVYSEMEGMGNGAFLAKMVVTGLDRLEEVTDIPEQDTSDQEIKLEHFDISLDQVSFAYDEKQTIDRVTLRIPERSTCAIIGPSGAGKTTLCSLIARFWDVDAGTITIGGEDIRDYTADSLMQYISIVFQNVYLFNDTIGSNIRFGNPEATQEQVTAAAKRANCHDFIMNLPAGYDTIVGEGGSTLSGGEKQRISIARAILKDAPIIILDEATSSMDPENEQELLTALSELTRGKTLISIAHRLSTVKNADLIAVIEHGRLVQKGRHDELIGQTGIYRRFWEHRQRAVGWKL